MPLNKLKEHLLIYESNLRIKTEEYNRKKAEYELNLTKKAVDEKLYKELWKVNQDAWNRLGFIKKMFTKHMNAPLNEDDIKRRNEISRQLKLLNYIHGLYPPSDKDSLYLQD